MTKLCAFFLFCWIPFTGNAALFMGNSLGVALYKDHVKDIDFDFKPGISEMILLGYTLPDNCRVEIQLGYSYNRIGDIKIDGNPTAVGGNLQTLTAAFNSIYMIPLCGSWSLSAGLGVGYEYEHINLSREDSGRVKIKDKRYYYQILGGLHYQVSPCWEWSIDYRYLDPDDDIYGHIVGLSIRRFF